MGGGAVIFCSDTMNAVHRVESVFIEIPHDVFRMGKNIIVGVIYRPPGADVNECNIFLNEIL